MAETLPVAYRLCPAGSWQVAQDRVVLDYKARLLPRKRLETATGTAFTIDLAEPASLTPGDALELEDGRLVEVVAAAEPLVRLRAPDMTRLAWHIGACQVPCQIGEGWVLIQPAPALADMLLSLEAQMQDVHAPFLPEVRRNPRPDSIPARHVHHRSAHLHLDDEDADSDEV